MPPLTSNVLQVVGLSWCLIPILHFAIAQLLHREPGGFCRRQGMQNRPYPTDGRRRSLFIYVPPCFKENFKLLTIMLAI